LQQGTHNPRNFPKNKSIDFVHGAKYGLDRLKIWKVVELRHKVPCLKQVCFSLVLLFPVYHLINEHHGNFFYVLLKPQRVKLWKSKRKYNIIRR